MQLSKTGTLKTRYLGYGCVFKKNLNGYTLVSTTNPKYTPFIKKTLVESKWDLINEAEITINNKTYNAGTHLRAIKLISGTNILNSSGSATLTFQEGEI